MPSDLHRQALFVVPRAIIRKAIDEKDFTALKAIHRINALTVCKSAEHGWIGASFSCMELLSMLHLFLGADKVVLAKGHAAAAQYAVLYADGVLSEEDLKNYKNGSLGLEAHADIDMDTGSLGMCLSSVAGMAAAQKGPAKYAVVLGDGEMQEGQCYEALMTIKKLKLTSVVPIIDQNNFQSDNLCDEIMPIHDISTVLRGFGFEVLAINGHDPHEISSAWKTATTADHRKSYVILAKTTKAGGTNLLKPSTHPETGLLYHPWHTKVPKWDLYIKVIEEQIRHSRLEALDNAFKKHKAVRFRGDQVYTLPNTHRPVYKSYEIGTGKAFGRYLVKCLKSPQHEKHEDIAIVDADLATSCGINGAVNHAGYYEVGISEQDAISFAAGLALAGKRPVVNTYSNFLKRGFENIFISVIEGANVIMAGHYSGLCYHTDGKSHQSFDDLGVFSALSPKLLVVDPVTPRQAEMFLEKCFALDRPVYFRLRRTPDPGMFKRIDSTLGLNDGWEMPLLFNTHFDLGDLKGKKVRRSVPSQDPNSPPLFVTIGTVATRLAFDCIDQEDRFKHSPIAVVSVLNLQQPNEGSNTEVDLVWATLFKNHRHVIVIEDDPGALYKFVCSRIVEVCSSNVDVREQIGAVSPPLRVISKNVPGHGPSQRTLKACLQYFGFTVDSIKELFFNDHFDGSVVASASNKKGSGATYAEKLQHMDKIERRLAMAEKNVASGGTVAEDSPNPSPSKKRKR
jgi:transketolase